MRKWPRGLALIGSVLLALRAASAHPLGQESVDHYCRLNVTPGKVILVYTLDMAEIATAQEIRRFDPHGNAPLDDARKAAYAEARAREIAAGLRLAVNGHSLALTPVNAKITLRTGEANLPTLRLSAVMETAPGALGAALLAAGMQAGTFQDENDPDRVGWREIEVSGLGSRIVDWSVNGGPVIAAATLTSRTDARAVAFHFVPRADEGTVANPAAPGVKPAGQNGAAAQPGLAVWAFLKPDQIFLAVLLAGLGGLHALAAGDGKVPAAASPASNRRAIGSVADAAGIFVAGAAALFAAHSLLPATIYPWLPAVSGTVIAAAGLSGLFGTRHDGGRRPLPPHGPGGWNKGFSPGLSGWVVVLSAAASRQHAVGWLLLVAFGVGLATRVDIRVAGGRAGDRVPAWSRGVSSRVGAVNILAIGLTIAVPAAVELIKRYGG